MAYEVLMGLHYLHGFKVVMLDLKSPNVLLAADGTAKLADVGLARLMSVTSLSHKIPTGTWAWAAPEALLGNKASSLPQAQAICHSVLMSSAGKFCPMPAVHDPVHALAPHSEALIFSALSSALRFWTNPVQVNIKADMYSFGVLLWEIITLERPLQRGNLREIM